MINPEQSVSVSPSLTGSMNGATPNVATVSAYVGNQYLHICSPTSATTLCNEYTAALTITSVANDGVITWGNIAADTMTISGAYELPMLLNGTGTSNTNAIALLK